MEPECGRRTTTFVAPLAATHDVPFESGRRIIQNGRRAHASDIDVASGQHLD